MPHCKVKIQEIDIRRSDSREKINQNLNETTGNGSFISPKKNEISFNSKYNTIQVDNEIHKCKPNNNPISTGKNINFINNNNNKEKSRHFKSNIISKSHSADSFYVAKKNKNNNAYRTKKSYSFNKNFIQDYNLMNSINHYSNMLFNPISKNQNFNQSLTMSQRTKNPILDEPQNEPNHNENVNLNGLFYNERFSHFKKVKKRSYKSVSDSLDNDKHNLCKSSSKKKSLKRDNSKILRINYSSIDLNNSSIRENDGESKHIKSTKNYLNQSKDFSRDSFDKKSKIVSNDENVLGKENSVNQNVNIVEKKKQIDHKLNESYGQCEKNERLNNYNYRYDIYNLKGNNYKSGLNNQKDDHRFYKPQVYRAYLNQDYIIESLNMKLNKGSIVDVIFIGGNKQNEFLEKNFHENTGENQRNNIYCTKCYLIYDGNHYQIPMEYVEIQKF